VALRADRGREIFWIWDGLLALDAITLLSAPEKSGKTTLVSLLLDRRRQGGQLLGQKVWQGGTIVASEEEYILWSLRQPPLDFGSGVEFCRPSRSSRAGWRRFVDHVLDQLNTFDLLVIDTAMSFMPARQNDPRALRWALKELRIIAGRPAAILLVHQANTHPGRRRVRGPLAALADILVDMHVPNGDAFTRRRNFTAVGRYPGTCHHCAAELNAAGTDYVLLPSTPTPLLTPSGTLPPQLAAILHQSPTPLTRVEILARWPASSSPPNPTALARSLAQACEIGNLLRTGQGTKSDPFRYALARAPFSM
jgi:hypothetical protein